MLPEFPKARRRLNEIWNQAMFAAFHGADPFIAQIPGRAQKEGNAAFLGGREIAFEKGSTKSSFPIREAEGMSLEEYLATAVKLGSELGRQRAKGVFEGISSQPSPHAVPLKWDGPLTFNHIIDTWERMQIDFDAKGEPIPPQVLLNAPAYAEIKEKLPMWLEDAEFKRLWAGLLARKRKEFDEREACRRLVD
jgi:hypothetical protein